MIITFLPLYFSPIIIILVGLVFFIGIYSFVKVYKLYKFKQIKNIHLIIGFIISVSLYGILRLIYLENQKSLSIYFVGPLLMIFLPFIVHFTTKNIKKAVFVSKVSLIGISYTMLGIVLKTILNSING